MSIYLLIIPILSQQYKMEEYTPALQIVQAPKEVEYLRNKKEDKANEQSPKTKLALLQFTYETQTHQLEVMGVNSKKISNENTPFDKGVIGQKKLARQDKQDFVHKSDSPFLQHARFYCAVDQRRSTVRDLLTPYLSTPVTDLVEGIVLGGGKNLEKSFKNEVRGAGLSHVLSASGSNVSLFLLINSEKLRKKFGTYFTALLSTSFILGYLSIAGCTPPLIRAASSAVIAVLGNSLWKRKSSQFWLLLLTAAGMVVISANYLTNVSFQLSVAACLGLLIAPKLFPDKSQHYLDVSYSALKERCCHSTRKTARFTRVVSGAVELMKQLRKWASATCQTSLAIQFVTLPIVLTTFGELSTLAVVSNVAIVWLVRFIFIAALGTIFFSFVHFPLAATVFGQTTEYLSQFFIQVVHILGSWEFSTLRLSDSQTFCFLLIYLVGFLTYLVSNVVRKKRRNLVQRYLCH